MTLKQALWEIVRDENIIITNQNIDWLLDRASKKATGDAQALKESILERKGVIEENIPCALTSEEKVSEKDESNEELFKQALVEGLNRRFDREIEEAKKIEQIEEMAECCPYFWNGGCTVDAANPTDCDLMCEMFGFMTSLANAGYRKQSEGEWITPTVIGGRAFNVPHCSTCKGIPCGVDENTKFCPNCGARMSGGKNE